MADHQRRRTRLWSHRPLMGPLFSRPKQSVASWRGKARNTFPLIFLFMVIFRRAIDRVSMSADFIWWGAIGLEAVILFRASCTRLIRKYALFYAYVALVLLADILRLCCYQLTPNLYPTLYWQTELVTIVASYAVMIEIFRQSVRHNPGVARLTRNLLAIVFCLTLSYAFLNLTQDGFSSSVPRATADIGRYFRYVEGMLLLGMLWLFARYRIPLGRNLLGLIAGNTFWVSLNIANLAFWSLRGNEVSILLRRLLSASYLVTLGVWCVTLWSAKPDPVQPAETDIERDYEILAAKTRAIL